MSTKKLLAEQVRYKLEGGYPDIAAAVQEPDVIKALEQEINSLFKLQYLNTTLPSGETIPDNLCIFTYSSVSVSKFGDKSRATLPAIPISLPRNQGIHLVYDPANPDTPFIPILSSQKSLIRVDSLLDGMLGQTYYWVNGKYIIFSKDITLFDIANVTMELVVMDFSQYTNTDTLPLPADMESMLVDNIVKRFAPVQPSIPINDSYSTAIEKQTVK